MAIVDIHSTHFDILSIKNQNLYSKPDLLLSENLLLKRIDYN